MCNAALLYMLSTFITPFLLEWLAVLSFLELRFVALLCMLSTFIAPVLLDWLAVLRFLKFCCASTIAHFAKANITSLCKPNF
jgi:hypothetical protein